MTPIRVLVVDDQALFREGLSLVLSLHADVVVVGQACDGEEALRMVDLLRPDVILMDIKMPKLDGVATTRRLRASAHPCRVVALTTFDDDEYVFEALRAGAVGYLLKDAPSDKLLESVRAAARGESFLQPSIAAKVVAELARLSPRPRTDTDLTDRELEVVRLLARGASNKQIGAKLFLAEGTVKNHVTNILVKLRVEDRTQAALRAQELGLV